MTDSEEPTDSCKECLKLLLLHPPSIECIVFSSCVAGCVLCDDAESLRSTILDHVYAGERSLQKGSHKNELEQTSNTIGCILSIIGCEQLKQIRGRALTLNITVYNPAAAIDAIRRTDAAGFKELDELVKSLLSDSRSCINVFYNPMICDLIQESVKMLLRRDDPHIPLVLPVSCETAVLLALDAIPHNSSFNSFRCSKRQRLYLGRQQKCQSFKSCFLSLSSSSSMLYISLTKSQNLLLRLIHDRFRSKRCCAS